MWYSYQNAENEDADSDQPTFNRRQLQDKFKEFITNYYTSDTSDKQGRFLYREQLIVNKNKLLLDLQHIRAFDSDLAQDVESRPSELLPVIEAAAADVLSAHHTTDDHGEPQHFGEVQVQLMSSLEFGVKSMRELTSAQVTKLVMIPGIITAASSPKHKATHLTIQCKGCRQTTHVACRPGLGGALIPSTCTLSNGVVGYEHDCGPNPFVILGEKSKYVDQQQLKLQERPEDVPTGELPRTLLMVADRQLVSQVTPGMRVKVTGIYSTIKSKAGEKGGAAAILQQPYLRVTAIQMDAGDMRTQQSSFSDEEMAEFKDFARQPDVHKVLFRKIAPKIFSQRYKYIKRAIACLLFGGARKAMPDGTHRRGDINVLLLGDPSTAKSQFLKFASKVAPIAVYTSGKGSSAAGLTATVVQDNNTREFYLEGGAMVLADNGVVCIDEFDKMRPEDRVAIHEAMEQQTISIAKAGITTMLKSRTAVLAAANPPSGRYDDLKSTQDNIDLQSTILSRFDLIFIVRDEQNVNIDREIARMVLQTHSLAAQQGGGAVDDTEERWLRRYIQYCRQHCFPRLNEGSMGALADAYVEMRRKARDVAAREDSDGSAIPITVRQLEAVVRISEALARMCLQPDVSAVHVAMAIQLFKRSTLDAVQAGITEVEATAEELPQLQRLEEKLKMRLHIGGVVLTERLVSDMERLGEERRLIHKALRVLVKQGMLELRNERRTVTRLR